MCTIQGGYLCDSVTTRFGIRTIEVIPHRGFYLNGHHRKFKEYVTIMTLVHSVPQSIEMLCVISEMLKEMGCDAVRTSHNMPDPQLVELCDEMGFMMMIEPFDEWGDCQVPQRLPSLLGRMGRA